MDLLHLKNKFQAKLRLIDKLFLLLSLVSLVATIVFELNSVDTLPLVFFLTFFSSIVIFGLLYGTHYQKMKNAQIQYIYATYLLKHQTKTDQVYESINVKNIKKEDFNGFSLFKNRQKRFDLYLLAPGLEHRLYFISIYTNNRIETGYLFSYPINKGLEPEELVKRVNKTVYDKSFKTTTHHNNHFLFYSLQKPIALSVIPHFKTFNEKEIEKVSSFAHETLNFFDDMNQILQQHMLVL